MIGVCRKIFIKKESNVIPNCIEYLNSKYDDTFTYIGPIDDFQPTRSSCEIYVNSLKFPDEEIYVRIDYEKDKSFSYHDNYLQYKYKNDILALLSELAMSIYGECRVASIILPNSADRSDIFDGKTSFSDFIGSKYSFLYLRIYLPPGCDRTDKELKFKEIGELLSEKQICCELEIRYTKDEDTYYKERKWPWDEQNEAYTFTDFAILYIDDKYNVSGIEWQKEGYK